MSKSLPPGGTIYLQDDPKVLTKKIRSAVTDMGREVVVGPDKPGITNLIGIHAALTGQSTQEVERAYAGKGYGEFKADVAAALVATLEPIQTRFREIVADPGELDRILGVGADKAEEVASATLATAFDRVGFLPRARGAH